MVTYNMLPSWTFILVFGAIVRVNSDNPNCKDTEKCACVFKESNEYEYQCPPRSNSSETTLIYVYPGRKMRIFCNKRGELDRSILPKASFETVRNLVLIKCPIPQNGFQDVLGNFNMTNLDKLFVGYYAMNRSLSSMDMDHFYNLEIIELRQNNITIEDKAVWKNHPNLKELVLNKNNITLKNDMFEYTPNLTKLFLHETGISRIPKNTLNHLEQLKHLGLWMNDLKILELGVFDNLKALEVLDLSQNKLERIEIGVFRDLKSIKKLRLSRNYLIEFSRASLENCENLNSIRLDGNVNITLKDEVFSNWNNLEYVCLGRNRLKFLSENLFEGSINLNYIGLNNNLLTSLPKKIFENLKKLKTLDLEFNSIETLPAEIFSSLESLEVLNLSHNNLETVDQDLLKNLRNLKEIKLDHNKISKLHQRFLFTNENLNTFSMSHNKFDFDDDIIYKTLFLNWSTMNLKKINLSYNKVTWYPYDLHRLINLEEIQLQHNEIREISIDDLGTTNVRGMSVNLNSNKISVVYLDHLDYTGNDTHHGSATKIQISDNPIFCDCQVLNFIRYTQEQHDVKEHLDIDYSQLYCSGPRSLRNKPVSDVMFEQLSCELDRNCTENGGCGCRYTPASKKLSVDCSRMNLTTVPQLMLSEISDNRFKLDYNQIEVHLEDNILKRLPSEFEGYNNVTQLYLQGNEIANITWLPGSLKLLNLSRNAFKYMNSSSLEVLNKSNVEHIDFEYNAWQCDCSLMDFIEYLKTHLLQVDMPRCDYNGTKLVDIYATDVCFNAKETVLYLLVTILLCIAIVAIFMTFYFTHQKEIKIWLYARGLCQCWIVEEELDKDKTYDAFISFSSKDEEFVVKNIMSVLESGEQPFKLCVHLRDWIPGEMIHTQVMNSVKNSKRTMVILTSNFLESVWGKVEFKTAHTEAMIEGRARVIIVIYGDIDMDKLDDDLKAYIKTNTYIKWGDPWFWDRMRYALPRRPNKITGTSKKLANIMQVIDDKFLFVTKGAKIDSRPDITTTISNSEEYSLTTTVA